MRLTVIVTLVCAIATSAYGQESVVRAAKDKLVLQGQKFETNCDAFKIVKIVACELKSAGAQLVGKRQPQNGCYPGGSEQGYSHDVIAFPTGWKDILQNAGPPDNGNIPVWNDTNPSAAQLFDPFDCDAPVPVPVPTPTPTPQPTPTPAPGTDLTPILDKLNEIAAQIGKVDQNVSDGRKENQDFYKEVGIQWKRITTFIGKYIAPAIAAYLIGDKVAN